MPSSTSPSITPSPKSRRLSLLKEIYPAEEAELADAEITRLLSTPAPESVRHPSDWSEKEVLLITYGDQVREQNTPPLQTLHSFLRQYAGDLVSGVHILPHFPSSSDDGFSVMDYYSVDPALGNWEDVQNLGPDFSLMFDAVINHASAQGNWFSRFLKAEPGWETAFVTIQGDPDLSKVIRPRALPLLTEFETAMGPQRLWTTFSADQVDLNYADTRVLLRIIEVLIHYVRMGAGYLRLDAIAFLWKEPGTTCLHLPQTHAVVRLLRAIFDEWAPGVRLITETNVPHADNVSYFGNGSDEAHMVYNFALPPLVLHTLATGDSTRLTDWASSLTPPSNETTFFNFLASHDGIGINPVRGILSQSEIDFLVNRVLAHKGLVSEKNNPDGTRSPYELNINYFDALSDPEAGEPLEIAVARFLCAASIQLALQAVPGIYFHSLFGSRGDRAGAATSGIPRRVNRQKFTASELRRDLSDPDGIRSAVLEGWKQLLQARMGHPAFAPHSPQRIHKTAPEIFAVERGDDSTGRVLVLCNVRNVSVPPDPVPGWEGESSLILYGRPGTAFSPIPPYGTRWLAFPK